MASVGAYAWKISAAVRIPAVSIERGPGPVSRMKRLASVERFSFPIPHHYGFLDPVVDTFLMLTQEAR
jgi:hypothetical protein